MKLNERGLLVVISGPSGVGKSSVRKALFSKPGHSFVYSVSATTRSIRHGETDGIDYHFLSRDAFLEKIKNGELLEYAEFCGNYYGTLKSEVEKNLDAGHEVILEIEVEGALQVKEKVKDAVFIFIVPPTRDAIEIRLRNRGSESEETINMRLAKAKKEFALANRYDYIVVNDDIHNAADRILAIIRAEHAKTSRSIDSYLDIIKDKRKEN